MSSFGKISRLILKFYFSFNPILNCESFDVFGLYIFASLSIVSIEIFIKKEEINTNNTKNK